MEFKKSFTESKPFLNRHNCILQQISKANPGKRIAFMGWNDYVMSVSQMSTVGDHVHVEEHQFHLYQGQITKSEF